MTILEPLQKITDDKLKYKTESDGRIRIKVISLNYYGKCKPKGTKLIRRLNSSKRVVTIELGAAGTGNTEQDVTPADAIDGTGSDAQVSFDPTSNPAIPTLQPNGNVVPQTGRPNQVGLGHELIHADRSMRGVAIDYSLRAPFTFKDASGATVTIPTIKEELATVGLKFNTSSDVTENDLRREPNQRSRGSY